MRDLGRYILSKKQKEFTTILMLITPKSFKGLQFWGLILQTFSE